LRAATETSPRATVLSVDAVGASDHVTGGSMLGALLARPALQLRQSYGTPSTYTWLHDAGQARGRRRAG